MVKSPWNNLPWIRTRWENPRLNQTIPFHGEKTNLWLSWKFHGDKTYGLSWNFMGKKPWRTYLSQTHGLSRGFSLVKPIRCWTKTRPEAPPQAPAAPAALPEVSAEELAVRTPRRWWNVGISGGWRDQVTMADSLVVWLPSIWHFPRNIGLLIIPIDFNIFQRGGYTTTNQLMLGFFSMKNIPQTYPYIYWLMEV